MNPVTNRIIIWCLFDDGESSYKKAIEKYFDGKFQVHSIGINNIDFPRNELYFYHKIDLRLTNEQLMSQIHELPQPDIILASPPCESWSIADCGGRMIKWINHNNWKIANCDYYIKYNKLCKKNKIRYFEQKEKNRIIGEDTIGATIKIIDHYKPKCWVIENPTTSLIWDYIKFHWSFDGIINKTFYSSYDFTFSLKPTTFKSNIKINLLEKKSKLRNKEYLKNNSYNARSKIPDSLIKDLLEKILKKVVWQ
jgi:site-specific DNA-cytosine methylase